MRTDKQFYNDNSEGMLCEKFQEIIQHKHSFLKNGAFDKKNHLSSMNSLKKIKFEHSSSLNGQKIKYELTFPLKMALSSVAFFASQCWTSRP